MRIANRLINALVDRVLISLIGARPPGTGLIAAQCAR
jgi:hypothetical protein